MVAKLVAVALAATALLGMSPAPAPVATQQGAVYTAPAQQQQRPVTASTLSAIDEVERVQHLDLLTSRRRREWDGKNRSSGDRAHKRMKRRRSSGRA